ncbi:MAG: AMP-binding protein [Pirellulaceae bacterium]
MLPRLDEAITARQDGGDPLPAIKRATFADADRKRSCKSEPTSPADDPLEFRAPDRSKHRQYSLHLGTTSTPKGVVHCGPALLDAAHAFNEALGFTADTRIYHHAAPLTWPVTSTAVVSVGLRRLGGARATVGRAHLLLVLAASARARSQRDVVGSQHVGRDLLKVDRDRTAGDGVASTSNSFIVGTAPLPHVVREAWETKYGVDCHESYGLSETLFISSASARTTKEKGSVGRLLAGVRLTTDASATTPLGTDDDPIWASVPWMFLGYLGDDGQPDPETAPSVYPTGDRGLITAQGNLSIVGRDKDLIIRGGRNISPVAARIDCLKCQTRARSSSSVCPTICSAKKSSRCSRAERRRSRGDSASPPLTVRPKDDPAWSWIGQMPSTCSPMR